jgi:hypothetical protein
LTNALERSDQNIKVGLHSQVIRVEQRSHFRVRRCGGDRSSRSRRDQDNS